MPRGGGGEGSVSGSAAAAASSAAATWRLSRQPTSAAGCARSSVRTSAGPAAAFSLVPLSPCFLFLFFKFSPCLRSPWKPQKGSCCGLTALRGVLPAPNRHSTRGNAAGNEALCIRCICWSQGWPAASPPTSCSL